MNLRMATCCPTGPLLCELEQSGKLCVTSVLMMYVLITPLPPLLR